MSTPPSFVTMSVKPSKLTMSPASNVSPVRFFKVNASSCMPPALPPPFWLPKKNAALILNDPPRKFVDGYAGIVTLVSRGIDTRNTRSCVAGTCAMIIESARDPSDGSLVRVSRPTMSMLIAPSIEWPVAPVLPSKLTAGIDELTVLTRTLTATMPPTPPSMTRAPSATVTFVHNGLRGLLPRFLGCAADPEPRLGDATPAAFGLGTAAAPRMLDSIGATSVLGAGSSAVFRRRLPYTWPRSGRPPTGGGPPGSREAGGSVTLTPHEATTRAHGVLVRATARYGERASARAHRAGQPTTRTASRRAGRRECSRRRR